MITILHRGGYGQKITILHREGGVYRDPQKWLHNLWMTPNKKMGCCSKKYGFLPKKLFFWPKNHFFLRYAQITQLFRLRRTQLKWIISSPCPEVALDTFGFPVGAHSAAWRAVSKHWLPKIALLSQNAIFGPSSLAIFPSLLHFRSSAIFRSSLTNFWSLAIFW